MTIKCGSGIKIKICVFVFVFCFLRALKNVSFCHKIVGLLCFLVGFVVVVVVVWLMMVLYFVCLCESCSREGMNVAMVMNFGASSLYFTDSSDLPVRCSCMF